MVCIYNYFVFFAYGYGHIPGVGFHSKQFEIGLIITVAKNSMGQFMQNTIARAIWVKSYGVGFGRPMFLAAGLECIVRIIPAQKLDKGVRNTI
jgi:ABC-type multidrug transport system permease subunit